jgi:hypothetical protein
MMEDVSLEELEKCLEAISRSPKGAPDIRRPPGEVYGHTDSDGRYIYINFVKPSEVPIGSIYRTWVVRFESGKPERILHFRSRRGDTGDDTLPPDE